MIGLTIGIILGVEAVVVCVWAIIKTSRIGRFPTMRKDKYLNALAEVVPYCKEQLLMNDVPYVARELVRGADQLTFRDLTLDGVDSSLNYKYLEILYGDNPCTDTRFRFLYYLIVCITEIDHIIYFRNSTCSRIDTTDLDNAMMTLINTEPETYAQLPQYLVILHDVVHKYKNEEFKRIHGESFDGFWYGGKFDKNDDIENNMEVIIRQILR